MASSSIWVGQGLTSTLPSCTLYCPPLPPSTSMDAVRGLFSSSPDFVALRLVRGMTFIDFTSEAGALAAMRRHNGALKSEALPGGLALDFDRDKREKRNAAYEHARKNERDEALFCVLCHLPALFLAAGTRLEALPRRATDGAHAVEEAAVLRHLVCQEGEALLLRREGGKVERQVPLCCKQCKVRWGYRPAPLGQPARCLYIHERALTHSLRGGEEGHLLREEIKGALKRKREGGDEGGASQRGEAGAAGPAEGPAAGDTAGGGEGGAAAQGDSASAAGASGAPPSGAAEGQEGEAEEGEGAGHGAAAEDSAFSSERLAQRYAKFLAKKAGGSAPPA